MTSNIGTGKVIKIIQFVLRISHAFQWSYQREERHFSVSREFEVNLIFSIWVSKGFYCWQNLSFIYVSALSFDFSAENLETPQA